MLNKAILILPMKKRKVSSTGKFSFTPSSTSDQLDQATSRMFYGWADNSSTCDTPFGSVDSKEFLLNGVHIAGIWYTTKYGDPESIQIDYGDYHYDDIGTTNITYRYLRLINHTHGVSITLFGVPPGLPVSYTARVISSNSSRFSDIEAMGACLMDKTEQVWEIEYAEYEANGVITSVEATDPVEVLLVRNASVASVTDTTVLYVGGEVVATLPSSEKDFEVTLSPCDILAVSGVGLMNKSNDGVATELCGYCVNAASNTYTAIQIADIEDGFTMSLVVYFEGAGG